MKKPVNTTIKGEVTLQSLGKSTFSEQQIALLRAIENTGSITQAAREVGISYKTAWDRVEHLNNLSERAIVIRSAGGAKGGGTSLTELGKNIVTGFEKLKGEHQTFLDSLNSELSAVSDFANFATRTTMKSSARNQFGGTVSKVTRGSVNTVIELALSDSLVIVATMTNDSQKEMNLKKGDRATALIKASWILLSNDVSIATSARNNIKGTVVRVKKGEVNSEVILDIGNGKTLCATVTNQSADNLGIKKAQVLLAFFKASSVILLSA